ncbi:hypothetical protein ADUPG1_014117, partial [Aduncisulcus paluster]
MSYDPSINHSDNPTAEIAFIDSKLKEITSEVELIKDDISVLSQQIYPTLFECTGELGHLDVLIYTLRIELTSIVSKISKGEKDLLNGPLRAIYLKKRFTRGVQVYERLRDAVELGCEFNKIIRKCDKSCEVFKSFLLRYIDFGEEEGQISSILSMIEDILHLPDLWTKYGQSKDIIDKSILSLELSDMIHEQADKAFHFLHKTTILGLASLLILFTYKCSYISTLCSRSNTLVDLFYCELTRSVIKLRNLIDTSAPTALFICLFVLCHKYNPNPHICYSQLSPSSGELPLSLSYIINLDFEKLFSTPMIDFHRELEMAVKFGKSHKTNKKSRYKKPLLSSSFSMTLSPVDKEIPKSIPSVSSQTEAFLAIIHDLL